MLQRALELQPKPQNNYGGRPALPLASLQLITEMNRINKQMEKSLTN